MPLSSATVQCTKLFAAASTPFPASDRRARHDGTRSFSSTVLCTPYSVVTCSNIGAGSVLINLSRACSTPFSTTALPESGKPFVKSHYWSCPISGAFLALWPGTGKTETKLMAAFLGHLGSVTHNFSRVVSAALSTPHRSSCGDAAFSRGYHRGRGMTPTIDASRDDLGFHPTSLKQCHNTGQTRPICVE